VIVRRAVLAGLGGVALAAGAWATGAYRATMTAAQTRLARRSLVTATSAGPVEYAVVGRGPPLMMIHDTGGGFDQGLLFAHGLLGAGFQIVAPSRFGYLRNAFPEDSSPSRQADVLAELLDHLGIDRIAVAGGSAGALAAAEFAVRHPDRCASRPHRAGGEPDRPRSGAIHRGAAGDGRAGAGFGRLVLGLRNARAGDAAAHAARHRSSASGQGLPGGAAPGRPDRRRADADQPQDRGPAQRRALGRSADGDGVRCPIAAPTLILSCEDDLFGTAETARLLAGRIPDARLVVYPEGGHIWLGQDADLTGEITRLIMGKAGP
jgi:2-hydroxy-6-oxonona-2,4-dienedioate hydrolase